MKDPEMSVKKFMNYMLEKDGPYIGLPANLIFADTYGDIAYMMLSPSPIRKNKTPFIGARILDGTTSDFDWEGFADIKDLPRSLNPKKGYIVTANNRQVPDNSKFDHGAAQMSTGRAQRIDEMLRL
jgi:penicillin amidase